MVNPISDCAVRKYMKVFVQHTRDGVVHISADHERLAALRRQKSFDFTLHYLENAGLISLFEPADIPPIITLTDDGITYLERRRDLIHDRRWTRGLAIAALLISIGSLIVSVIALTKP